MNEPADTFELDDQSVSKLMQAARDGARLAQDDLFRQLYTYLAWVANRELDPQLKAKMGPSDVVQQSFARAIERFDDFRGQTPEELRAWVRQILMNELKQAQRTFYSQKRDVAREQGINLDSRLVGAAGAPADSMPTPGTHAIAAEETEALRAAMQRLPDDYRQIIELRNWQRLPFKEIADKMNSTTNAVTKLWFRALVRLEKEMEGGDE